jgi:hypothetical protein
VKTAADGTLDGTFAELTKAIDGELAEITI